MVDVYDLTVYIIFGAIHSADAVCDLTVYIISGAIHSADVCVRRQSASSLGLYIAQMCM